MVKSYSIIFFFLLLGACSPLDEETKKQERNKQNAEAYIDTIWNKKELKNLKNYFSSTFIRTVNNIDVANDYAELNANLNVLFKSFPDLHMYIENILTTKNTVFLHWSITGTNTGEFNDRPRTGKKIEISGITSIDFDEEGMMVYENSYFNELFLMQQLGYKLIIPKDNELESNINQN